MGIVRRMIEPGLVVRVHTGVPGPHGGSEIASSRPVPAAAWSEGDSYIRNMTIVGVTATGSGQARYVSVWIEGRLRGYGPLREMQMLVTGDTATFLRGDLTVRLGDGR